MRLTGSGIMKKQVVVHSYEKIWADDFVEIRDELNTVLKDLALRIEHVKYDAPEPVHRSTINRLFNAGRNKGKKPLCQSYSDSNVLIAVQSKTFPVMDLAGNAML